MLAHWAFSYFRIDIEKLQREMYRSSASKNVQWLEELNGKSLSFKSEERYLRLNGDFSINADSNVEFLQESLLLLPRC